MSKLFAMNLGVAVISVSPARHFVMFDQPQRVADAIRNYLNAL
jgi:pimeloyl-ACP methyl ester carboxylesterase